MQKELQISDSHFCHQQDSFALASRDPTQAATLLARIREVTKK
jgi:hypothetical protein